ncbi:amidase signature domain-containing protein [Plectosphaerella plurivora]|uniref:amidase n=1 Tax=Plectosphaerella plurivora TaxID=936078 RepID=A0A9P8V5G2_9PEZI|nr:amidase signature domain-containing protein [Plectosphaerella plurivora]
MTWEETAKAEKARVEESIPAEWRIETPKDNDSSLSLARDSGLLTEDELQITETSAVDLVKGLATGKLTSVAVTRAFCKRAALAHQAVNCLHDFFPEEALARAKELDQYYAENGKPIGPLHGLPISLKDQLRVKGRQTHMGYVGWVNKVDDKPSVLVDLLARAGAVFYVKTSVPQSLMVCETLNNINGRTLNPRNKNWSCGGSSGGEGAIVGFRGGIIGIGTDIGGSIRVPAAFNFLYGLRPSHGRLPYGNMANSMEGQETVHSVVGPLAHSVADMRLFVKSVLEQQPWEYDSKVIPMPWRQGEEDAIKDKISSGKLTLGFYECDGNVMPHPPILRGIKTVVDSLKSAGHTVLPWEPYKHPYAVDLIGGIYASDGGTDIFNALKTSGEPAIPNIADLVNPSLPKLDVNAVWEAQLKKWAYQTEYLEAIRAFEAQHGAELDAIIAPITPTAAIRHDQFRYYGYASAINLLDFSTVTVPVTFADKAVDVVNEAFKPLSDTDATVQAEYDPEAYHGAPVAVQIIGRRLTEEKILAIAEEIGRLVGNEVTP